MLCYTVVLKECRAEQGCFWVYKRVPLNLQWPVLKSGVVNFQQCWLVDSMH